MEGLKMKMKAMLLPGFFLIVLSLMFIGTQNFPKQQTAYAQQLLWADVTLDLIVQRTDHIRARFTEIGNVPDPFQRKLFSIPEAKANQMLAILLTAESSDKNLEIAFYDGNPAEIFLIILKD